MLEHSPAVKLTSGDDGHVQAFRKTDWIRLSGQSRHYRAVRHSPLGSPSALRFFGDGSLHDPPIFRGARARLRRGLEPRGRAIFVEPGAAQQRARDDRLPQATEVHDPSWIERDVVLEDIEGLARTAGLTGLTILPMPHPRMLIAFTLREWQAYRAGDETRRRFLAERLAEINYNERVVFYCDR